MCFQRLHEFIPSIGDVARDLGFIFENKVNFDLVKLGFFGFFFLILTRIYHTLSDLKEKTILGILNLMRSSGFPFSLVYIRSLLQNRIKKA